jgi:toxin FitB
LIYLLDTCVVSEFVKPLPAPSVIHWLRKNDDRTMAISVITLGEIQSGISRLESGRRRDELQAWLVGKLIPRFDQRILSLSLEDALAWGELAGKARRMGRPLPAADALIAATAISHRLTLVTRNTQDFEPMSVPLLNPWTLG